MENEKYCYDCVSCIQINAPIEVGLKHICINHKGEHYLENSIDPWEKSCEHFCGGQKMENKSLTCHTTSERRLIDAYALAEQIHDSKYHNPHKDIKVARNHGFEHDHFLKMVCLAPTVDAVEVVRCKDCKCAYINSFSAASGVAVCKKWSNEAKTVIVQHDDFCSYGERREGE